MVENLPIRLAHPATPAALVAPHNLEAEQALLGAVLADNRTLEKVGDFLRAEHFYQPAHQKIWQAIITLTERGQIANPITLKAFFEQDANLTSVGGAQYLQELMASTVSLLNSEDYGRLIFDLFLRRELMQVGEQSVLMAANPTIDKSATDILEETEQQLFDLATTGETKGGFVDFNVSLQGALRMAEAAYKRSSHVTGITTGLVDMDKKMGGLQPSDLIILAGRPSMGKTALATNMAYNAAKAFIDSNGQEGGAVGLFSLEMSAEQLATRLLSDASSVPSDKIRRGEVGAEDFTKFVDAAKTLTRLPIFIDDSAGLTVGALRTRARRLKRQHGKLGLLVVDYLQLMSGSSSRSSENRVLEISEITRGLKGIAKELNIPVLALSQLSRQVENREDKRPQLADLRESGSIEQDADVVMFVFREQYYLERAEPQRRPEENDERFNDRYQRWQQRCELVYNTSEVIIAKQRHGPVGSVRLHFDGRYTRFSDLDTTHQLYGAESNE